MSNERDLLADLLKAHRYKPMEAVCSCSNFIQVGLKCDPETHEQHVATVLLLAGFRQFPNEPAS